MREDDAVGYKSPPARTRFRAGRSGNPAGRPKRRPSFRDALLAELAQTVPGKDSQRAGSKLQVLIRSLVDSAIGGNARAQAVLIGVLARIGDVEDQEPNSLTPDDREILDAYVSGALKRREGQTDTTPSAGERHED